MACRNLVIVLGDQLALDASAFDGFDPAHDQVWMAEVEEESTHVWSSQIRIALFLSAMRHFAEALSARGFTLTYQKLDDINAEATLGAALTQVIRKVRPTQLLMTAPGDWRVLQAMRAVSRTESVALEIRPDRYFYISVSDFKAHMAGRKSLRMEFFYRDMRRRHRILMDGDQPVGGQWNFDSQNRKPLNAKVLATVPAPLSFEPDEITSAVLTLVASRFGHHPGSLQDFSWPVTREQALQSLQCFVSQRLPDFGRYQDAMWPDQVWLFHSHLSSSLNLKLIDPREVVDAAEQAYRSGAAPLASVEGFIRQVIGWREYVRGIYWTQMPGYLEQNSLNATLPLPTFYWNGATEMSCLSDALKQTLRHGYANHIQRLMVTGLYALLLGVDPKAVHEWYLSVYVDAVEWVEAPNTLGMSQYADGGFMASKPYVASGRYIDRMSPYCKGCRYDPSASSGENACPMTVLYWDFMMRHQERLKANPRMAMQLLNLEKLQQIDRENIRAKAESHRREVSAVMQNHSGYEQNIYL